MSNDTPQTKICKICGQEKPLSLFNKHPSSTHGVLARCIECVTRKNREKRRANLDLFRQKDRERFYRDRERIRARRKAAYVRNPESAKENARQWRLDNLERAKENGKRNYAKRDKAKERERLRAYDKTHPEKKRAAVERRRALRKGSVAIWNDLIWQECLVYWGHKCCICNRPVGLWHILAQEHWIAMADPRPDNPYTVPWNMLPMCHSTKGAHGIGDCNHSKSDKDPIEWLHQKYSANKAETIIKRIEAYFQVMKDRYGK